MTGKRSRAATPHKALALTLLCAAAVLPARGAVARQSVAAQTADPPLPVPRPHFPEDVPPPLTAKPAAPATPVPPAPPQPAPGGASTCLDTLKAQNVGFEPAVLPPQPDPQCTVAEPVRLLGLHLPDGAAVALPDRPIVACATGAVFSDFVRSLLSPLAKGSYGSTVAVVATGPGLDCRTRDHIPGAKISAHGQGLAIDIADLILTDGHRIDVGQPKTDADRMFDKAARAGACGFFHTALGPGADSFHETHWHFDIIPRGAKGETKICE